MRTANRGNGAGGIMMLLGFFCLFCAAIFVLAAGWRGIREYRTQSHWVEVTARVEKCGLDLYHPFSRDGGGTTYTLRCRLAYDFGGASRVADLRTSSSRSEQARVDIENWALDHPAGAPLAIRVDPGDPTSVRVPAGLPVPQFFSARDAVVTAIAFGLPGTLLLAIGRRLRFPPAPKT